MAADKPRPLLQNSLYLRQYIGKYVHNFFPWTDQITLPLVWGILADFQVPNEIGPEYVEKPLTREMQWQNEMAKI